MEKTEIIKNEKGLINIEETEKQIIEFGKEYIDELNPKKDENKKILKKLIKEKISKIDEESITELKEIVIDICAEHAAKVLKKENQEISDLIADRFDLDKYTYDKEENYNKRDAIANIVMGQNLKSENKITNQYVEIKKESPKISSLKKEANQFFEETNKTLTNELEKLYDKEDNTDISEEIENRKDLANYLDYFDYDLDVYTFDFHEEPTSYDDMLDIIDDYVIKTTSNIIVSMYKKEAMEYVLEESLKYISSFTTKPKKELKKLAIEEISKEDAKKRIRKD